MPSCMPMKRRVCVFYHNWATSAKREKKNDFVTYLKFIHSKMVCIQNSLITWVHNVLLFHNNECLQRLHICMIYSAQKKTFFFMIGLCAGDGCLGRVIQLSAYPGRVHSYCCHLGILWWWSLGVALNWIDFRWNSGEECDEKKSKYAVLDVVSQ